MGAVRAAIGRLYDPELQASGKDFYDVLEKVGVRPLYGRYLREGPRRGEEFEGGGDAVARRGTALELLVAPRGRPVAAINTSGTPQPRHHATITEDGFPTPRFAAMSAPTSVTRVRSSGGRW